MTQPKTCVIYNPAAGRGRAGKIIAQAQRFPYPVELIPTTAPGSATEQAQQAIQQGYQRVIAAGGDGTVHEVANGILQTEQPDVILGVWPIGSMNDYAYTLGMEAWWRGTRDPAALQVLQVDVGRIEADHRQCYFINGCGFGFNGMVTIEARKIRYLRGIALYSLAVMKSLVRHFRSVQTQVNLDGNHSEGPILAFSLGIGQREGGFPLMPVARLDDGYLEWLQIQDVTRWEMLRHFPGMISGNLPLEHPKVHVGRCQEATFQFQHPTCIHTDGELFAVPEDGIRDVRVSLLPGRFKVEYFPEAAYGGKRFEHLAARYTR